MAAVIRSNLGPIVLFLRDQLVTVLGWPEERVRVCSPQRLRNKDGSTNHPHGDGYCLVWPGGLVPNQDCIIGGGRVDARLIRTIHVSLRTRFGADEQSEAIGWLTDVEFGHCWLEEQMIDALLLCQPNDAEDATGGTGNWLVTEPVTIRTAEVPELERLDPDWGESRLAVEVSYPFNCAQDRQ